MVSTKQMNIITYHYRKNGKKSTENEQILERAILVMQGCYKAQRISKNR